MSFFDLHCDTVYEAMLQQNISLQKNSLALDLQRGTPLSPWIQTFAFWIPDDYRCEDAYSLFQKQYQYFTRQLETLEDLHLYCGKTDQKGCYAILSVEGGAVLGGKLARINDLKQAGIRMLTLCWNGANEIASGADATGGLTTFGRQAVFKLEQSNVIIDVSHLNEESFWDVARLVSQPFIATHSNAYSVCPHRRNLKTDQIKVIREAGGLIGLNFYKEFLGETSNGGIDALIRHIDFFLQLHCEDVLAIGSDFDGAEMPEDLMDITSITTLRQTLLSHFGVELTEKILFQNAQSFFRHQDLF